MYIRRKVFSIAHDENGEEKLFSTTDYQSQKEFASVRGAKKLAKRLLNSATKNGDFSAETRKEAGKVIATANRKGLAKNSEKYVDNKDFEKVVKSSFKPIEKATGEKLTKTEKDNIIKAAKTSSKSAGRAKAANGNKNPKMIF